MTSNNEVEYCDCGKIAVWLYCPGYSNGDNPCECDDCVNRNCSCNHEYLSEEYENYPEPTYVLFKDDQHIDESLLYYKWIVIDVSWQPVDNLGRPYPCCEYIGI